MLVGMEYEARGDLAPNDPQWEYFESSKREGVGLFILRVQESEFVIILYTCIWTAL